MLVTLSSLRSLFKRDTVIVVMSFEERDYVVDVLDMWLDGYKDAAEESDDEDIPQMWKDKGMGYDIRRKLARRRNG